MGLYVRLNIQPHQIHPERWDAVWLDGMQLLRQFPGPLLVRVTDNHNQFRHMLTSSIHFYQGTEQERWAVNGDLGSRRLGETYSLHRHLAHYREKAPPTTGDTPTDILSLPGNLLEDDVAGISLFDAKSQGFPFHYAMLAVSMLVEDAFSGQALVHGDITRVQAEKTAAWVEAILRRPVSLPVVTDADRLWQRLAAYYTREPEGAVRRFLSLYAGQPKSSRTVLLQLKNRPDDGVIRRVFRAELAQYHSLRERGALELIASMCEADGGLDRVFDYVFGPTDTKKPPRFTPEGLLECLCELLISIPFAEREVLDYYSPPADQLPTVSTALFQDLSSKMGKPVPCKLFMEEAALIAEFATRWPEQAQRLCRLLHASTTKTRRLLEESRQTFDNRSRPHKCGTQIVNDAFLRPKAGDAGYQPAAEFLYDEIIRQNDRPFGFESYLQEMAVQLRDGLAKNHTLRRSIDACDQSGLLEQISMASCKHCFPLCESAWERLGKATIPELRYLATLALMPNLDEDFSHIREHVLETPKLWPMLLGKEPA